MRSPTTYLDFDLAIQKVDGKYRARVIHSPNGQASGVFEYVISPQELERLHVRVGGEHRRTQLLGSPQVAELKSFGGNLYQQVFTAELRACLSASLRIASAQGKNLRLRLNLSDAPDLAALPWEFLYDASKNKFFCLSNETPLVRFFDLPDPLTPLRVAPPLRILVLISLYAGHNKVASAQEWENLSAALRDLQARGNIEVERIDEPTINGIQQILRQREINILHYIGDGEFDIASGQGKLKFHDEKTGLVRPIRGDMLGTILRDHEPLRLVILNASEGARPDRDNLFGGVAQALIQQGIPAVIAMQSEITDDAANAFSREFYRALADNYPIDAALAEARKAIYLDNNEVEWATPVLYLRAPDGVIFDVQGAPETKPKDTAAKRQRKVDPKTTTEMLKVADEFAAQQENKAGASEFNPIGRWDIQVQDMVGSRLFVEFLPNGTFQMVQQIGMFQMPVSGSWTYNPLTRQLALQGVINTFQPFILTLTLGGALQNGFSAAGSDGIGYVLARGVK